MRCEETHAEPNILKRKRLDVFIDLSVHYQHRPRLRGMIYRRTELREFLGCQNCPDSLSNIEYPIRLAIKISFPLSFVKVIQRLTVDDEQASRIRINFRSSCVIYASVCRKDYGWTSMLPHKILETC